MKFKTAIAVVVLASFLSLFVLGGGDFNKSNDRIYINGQILTMEENTPTADAMFVRDGKIAGLGTNQEMLEFKAGKRTRIKDSMILPKQRTDQVKVLWKK